MTATIANLEAAQAAALTYVASAAAELEAAKRATAVRFEARWVKRHDKYGRPAVELERIHIDADGRWVAVDRGLGVVVTLPKHVRTETPEKSYLANDWTRTDTAVTYHRSRKAALAHVEAQAAARGWVRG
jgi:hypothetical protein